MTPFRNSVRRQSLQVRVPSEAEALALRPRVADLNRRFVVPVLDRVLDEMAPAGRQVRLERLDLDLGRIPPERLEEEVGRRLERELRRALGDALREARPGPDGEGRRQAAGASHGLSGSRADRAAGTGLDGAARATWASEAAARREVLEHLLLHGTVPYWARRREGPTLAALLAEMGEEDPDGLVAVVRRLAHRDVVLERLAAQGGADGLHRLVRLLEPEHAALVVAYALDLESVHRRERLVPLADRPFQRLLWWRVQAWLLRERGSSFNRRSYLRSLLRGLAAGHGLDYGALLATFAAALARSARHHPVHASLPAVVAELLREELAGGTEAVRRAAGGEPGQEADGAATASTARAEVRHGEIQRAEGQRAEGQRGGSPPGETSPGETWSGETRPGETRSGETRSSEMRHGEMRADETRPGETRSGETRSSQMQPGGTRPDEIRPGETPTAGGRNGAADRAPERRGVGGDDLARSEAAGGEGGTAEAPGRWPARVLARRLVERLGGPAVAGPDGARGAGETGALAGELLEALLRGHPADVRYQLRAVEAVPERAAALAQVAVAGTPASLAEPLLERMVPAGAPLLLAFLEVLDRIPSPYRAGSAEEVRRVVVHEALLLGDGEPPREAFFGRLLRRLFGHPLSGPVARHLGTAAEGWGREGRLPASAVEAFRNALAASGGDGAARRCPAAGEPPPVAVPGTGEGESRALLAWLSGAGAGGALPAALAVELDALLAAPPSELADLLRRSAGDARHRRRWTEGLPEPLLARLAAVLEPQRHAAMLEAAELLAEAWREAIPRAGGAVPAKVAPGGDDGLASRRGLWDFLLRFLARNAGADRLLERLVDAFFADRGARWRRTAGSEADGAAGRPASSGAAAGGGGGAPAADLRAVGERLVAGVERRARLRGHGRLRALLQDRRRHLLELWDPAGDSARYPASGAASPGAAPPAAASPAAVFPATVSPVAVSPATVSPAAASPATVSLPSGSPTASAAGPVAPEAQGGPGAESEAPRSRAGEGALPAALPGASTRHQRQRLRPVRFAETEAAAPLRDESRRRDPAPAARRGSAAPERRDVPVRPNRDDERPEDGDGSRSSGSSGRAASRTHHRNSRAASSRSSSHLPDPSSGRPEPSPADPEIRAGLYVANAGLILAGPFLPRLFGLAGLLGEDASGGPAVADPDRAVHLLQFLVDGRADAPEADLALNKVLCGLPTSAVVDAEGDLDEAARTAAEQLLRSMLANWTALSGTSLAGLRETFLQREGRLELRADRWQLTVQRKTLDVLVDQVPWSRSVIFHRWMERPLHVDW